MIPLHSRGRRSFYACAAIFAVCISSFAADERDPSAAPIATEDAIRYHKITAESRLQHRRMREKPPAQTLKAVKELFDAKTYAELIKIPPRWRKEFPRNEFPTLVRELLRNMGSRRALLLSKPDFVLVSPYFGTTDMEKAFERKRLDQPVGGISQDVYIEGGRCAYALDMLFFLPNTLLPIWNSMTDEDLAYAVRENTFIIVEAMGVPDEIDFADMNAEQRERLAGKTRHFEILKKLQKDTERRVRLAMARRKELGLIEDNLLQDFRFDPDPEVREVGTRSWRLHLHETTGFPLDK